MPVCVSMLREMSSEVSVVRHGVSGAMHDAVSEHACRESVCMCVSAGASDVMPGRASSLLSRRRVVSDATHVTYMDT